VRWSAVVNSAAGRRHGTRAVDRLHAALAARGIASHVTASEEDGLRAARAAFDRGDGVLGCGGDGTLRVLAELAVATGGLLGVVPMGAGNDFARALGLDHRHALTALDALETGREARVDVGHVTAADGTSRVFTTVAHSGLDGEVNRRANEITWASGTMLYAIAALRTMASYRPAPMRIVVDGAEWSAERAWLVAVANTYCYGGGMPIAPTARIDDGALDLVVVGDVSRARVVASFPRMLRGTHLRVDGLYTFPAAHVVVEATRPQSVHASGEPVGRLPATIDVRPRALRVQVPATSPIT
jgi:diacylglycerol kinase (ATP)